MRQAVQVIENDEGPGPGVAGHLADPAAFAAFYEATLPRVFGFFVHRCGGNAGVAEELTQETFLTAVTALRQGRPVGTPLPWLFGIARHKLLDHYRRGRGRKRRGPSPGKSGAPMPRTSISGRRRGTPTGGGTGRRRRWGRCRRRSGKR